MEVVKGVCSNNTQRLYVFPHRGRHLVLRMGFWNGRRQLVDYDIFREHAKRQSEFTNEAKLLRACRHETQRGLFDERSIIYKSGMVKY